MFNIHRNWLLTMILVLCIAIPLGCAKREREPKKVRKEQISDFEQAMVKLKEAGVALDFSDLSNYTDERKILLDPKVLTEPEKQEKVDTAVKLLWEVLNITSISSNSLSLKNIMALNTQDSSGLTNEDLAYCYLELARLYTLRAAAIAASTENNFGVAIDNKGGYDFNPGNVASLNEKEVQDFVDMLYILFGLKLKYKGEVKSPSASIKDTYLPFKHEGTGFKGAVGLALQFVDLAGEVLSKDIKDALDKVKVYIEEFKNDVRSKESEWGFAE